VKRERQLLYKTVKKTTMKHLLSTFIIVMSFNLSIFSQTDKLIPAAKAVKLAYDNLIKNPDNKEIQKRYIIDFPDNAEVFKQVFHSSTFDQLYEDSHLYIFKLAELSKNFPDFVGDKLIRLCIGLKKWDADAIGHIQHVTMGYANSNYYDFIGLIKKLNKQDLNTLVTFLADVENHSAYGDYQKFMDKLKSNNEAGLFDLFENAKETKNSQNDHGF
jgi:hypothetical protein